LLSDRLAASDFTVPGGATSQIALAMTSLGQQTVPAAGSYTADVYVVMRGYGFVPLADAVTNESTLVLHR
jgi:hypothetical protein